MPAEIHKNDINIIIRNTLLDQDSDIVDLSAATLTYYFKKPSGDIVTKTGSLFSDGSDGKVQYAVESGVLDEVGDWIYQIKTEIGSGVWRSSDGCFTVHDIIE